MNVHYWKDMNKYKKINIKGKNFIIPLRENEVSYKNMGKLMNKNNNDLDICINLKNNTNFKVINNYDLEFIKEINLYQIYLVVVLNLIILVMIL